MRRKRTIGLVCLLLAFALVVSCASLQKAKEQPYDTWSPKKKLTNAINTYSREYDKYMAAMIRPNLTEGQRAYLRGKRKALVGLDKTIELLIPIVDSGGMITPVLESQLLDFLTQLGFQPM
jgi:hypothetical protein